MSEPRRVDDGCSYEVRRHPAMGQRPGEGFLDGAISLGGKLPVDRDLQPGDELTVTVCSADGEVLAQSVFEVQTVGFVPVRLKGFVIGQTRVHKAKPA